MHAAPQQSSSLHLLCYCRRICPLHPSGSWIAVPFYVLTHCAFLSVYPKSCCCSLTGRVGVKLSSGSVAYSAADLSPDRSVPKPADLMPASEPQRLPPGLFPRSQSHQLHSSQLQTNLLTHVLAVGAAPVRRSLLGHLQAYTSSQVDPTSLNALKASSPVPSPDTVAPAALDEDLNDDDAFDAICSLDAMLAPPSVQQPPPVLALNLRHGTERDRRQARPSSIRAHTSTTHTSSPEGQTGSPKIADSRRTAAARSTALGLWTAGQQTAAEAAAAAAPMRILKRPVIADQQAMSSAVSPPLAPKVVVSATSVCKASSACASFNANMMHSAARSMNSDVSPVSANLREDSDKSAQSHAQSHQDVSGSSSSGGSASEAPAATTVSLYNKAAFAKSHAAHHTDFTASEFRTAFASSLDYTSGQTHDPHHSSPTHQLLVELHQQPAGGIGLDADGKVGTFAALHFTASYHTFYISIAWSGMHKSAFLLSLVSSEKG